jgi:SAM-dependent methyltransferase
VLLNKNLYEDRAAEYAAHSDTSAYNAYYERPAMLNLVGDPSGKSILDLGCGAAPLLLQLSGRSATRLVGIDASKALVEIARRRVNPEVEIVHGRESQLRRVFRSQRFDVVVSSLVLHYVRSWDPLLRSVFEILEPGGRFLFSVAYPDAVSDDRREGQVVSEVWRKFQTEVLSYYRSMASIRRSLARCGFTVLSTSTPEPQEALKEVEPGTFTLLEKSPAFLLLETANDGFKSASA